jgi:D-alanine transaminase
VIIAIAKANNIACSERQITFSELQTASEIWVTSSTREIIPVVELDGKAVADGQVGNLWQTMNDLFQAYKQAQS